MAVGTAMIAAQPVSFFFSAAAEFQEGHALDQSAAVVEHITDYATAKDHSGE